MKRRVTLLDSVSMGLTRELKHLDYLTRDFNPSEARVGKGQEGGGRWTSGSAPHSGLVKKAKVAGNAVKQVAVRQGQGIKNVHNQKVAYRNKYKAGLKEWRKTNPHQYEEVFEEEYTKKGASGEPHRKGAAFRGDVGNFKSFIADPQNHKAFEAVVADTTNNSKSIAAGIALEVLGSASYAHPGALPGRAALAEIVVRHIGMQLASDIAKRTGTEDEGKKRGLALDITNFLLSAGVVGGKTYHNVHRYKAAMAPTPMGPEGLVSKEATRRYSDPYEAEFRKTNQHWNAFRRNGMLYKNWEQSAKNMPFGISAMFGRGEEKVALGNKARAQYAGQQYEQEWQRYQQQNPRPSGPAKVVNPNRRPFAKPAPKWTPDPSKVINPTFGGYLEGAKRG